jgi:hypothetical protein
MRIKMMSLLVLATLCLIPASAPATAKAPHKKATLCVKAYGVRQAVIKKHGSRAPGRNICRFGIRGGKKATTSQKARYIRQLRLLLEPKPYMSTNAGKPYVPPAGTASPNYAPSGLASCIVSRESGGDPNASNGQYTGIAQWSQEAWIRHGGGKFASTPTGATYQEQLQVLSNGLAKYGCRDWCPFDGCG